MILFSKITKTAKLSSCSTSYWAHQHTTSFFYLLAMQVYIIYMVTVQYFCYCL